MPKSLSLDVTLFDDGRVCYDLSPLLDDMSMYEAMRIAMAQLMGMDREKCPMYSGDCKKAINSYFSHEKPCRICSTTIGFEYMDEFHITVHEDGRFIARRL